MKFTAKQIAELLRGTVEGDSTVVLNQLTKIEEGCENSLSFLANPKYNEHLYSTDASAVIVNNSFTPEKSFSTTLIRVQDAYASFAELLRIVEDLQKQKLREKKKLYEEKMRRLRLHQKEEEIEKKFNARKQFIKYT